MLQILNVFYSVIAPIALIAFLGFVMDRRFAIETRSLSQVTIYLAGPALVFSSISHSQLQAAEFGQLVLFTVLVMGLLAVISGTLAKLLRLEQKLSSAFTLSSTLINAGNFGLPFIAFAFGEDGLSRAVVIFTTTSIVANTLGVFLASRGSGSVRQSLANVLKVPLPYAVLAGLLANGGLLRIPLPLDRGLSLLGDAAVPLMLVVLGAQLARTRLDSQLRLVALASGVKILLTPLLGIGVARLLLLSGSTASISIIQTSMPTAVISIVLAEEFGSDTRFVSSVVMVSTLVSFLSLTILLNLLG